MTSPASARLGRIGIWTSALSSTAPGDRTQITEAAAELEALGYGTIWIGASPTLDAVTTVLEATERVTVTTGIISVWSHEARDLAAWTAETEKRAPGRFVLGLGVSHDRFTPQYAKPYTKMTGYLDELDTAPEPVPARNRILAALGPRMLRLSAERALGAHPYLVTAEHTARARSLLGPEALLAPELKVVLDTDLERARATAREGLSFYLDLPNYTGNLIRLGFQESDFDHGGSDRLLDSLFALGSVERATARIEEFLAAGADHVSLQALSPGGQGIAALTPAWRELAGALRLG
ncbi:LLM class F420-dependent oxidoreductase [Streptomyces sp. NPDC001985]|uniref:LLM class F420-dependent oxidoreductase n=1 Tax=Streptomyces sp. NPDC001985 TaxID=3154406 RepID=UPI003328CE61